MASSYMNYGGCDDGTCGGCACGDSKCSGGCGEKMTYGGCSIGYIMNWCKMLLAILLLLFVISKIFKIEMLRNPIRNKHNNYNKYGGYLYNKR